jgi:hypothetical protein
VASRQSSVVSTRLESLYIKSLNLELTTAYWQLTTSLLV